MEIKHRYLAEEDVSKGILNKSLAHLREVFTLAIADQSVAIICIPKQPSAELVHSKEDLPIMERLVEVVKILSIPVLDHLILGH